MVTSGWLSTWRTPTTWLRSAILHLAAGVVFSVVAVELIPDLVRDHRPIETVIGFSLGVVAMLGLRAVSHNAEASAEEAALVPSRKVPLGLLAGVAIDVLVDGFMIGIGFAAGAKEGRLLAVALAVELVSLGLAVAASLNKRGLQRASVLKALFALVGTFLCGAIVGITLLQRLPEHLLAGILAFGAAALLFLVTEELLTEAHEEPESPMLTALFFVGFLFLLVLGMMT
ncbi:MAG: transporter [Deltaproteobacteria bacterium]|nr:transporter [Deltaproteobacteria bacterium]